MIKNSTFDVYDRMDKETLETIALAFEADLVTAYEQSKISKDDSKREFIKARLAIVYALLKYKFKEGS